MNLIEIRNEELTLLCDGFIPSGYVEMKVRRADGEAEGHALFFGVTNELHEPKGDYCPFELDKTQLREFIDYLEDQYKKIEI